MMNKSLLIFIQDQIDDIETDSRYRDQPASVFSNAPLALIQTELHAKRKVLITLREKILDSNSNGYPDANLFNPNELPFIDPEQI